MLDEGDGSFTCTSMEFRDTLAAPTTRFGLLTLSLTSENATTRIRKLCCLCLGPSNEDKTTSHSLNTEPSQHNGRVRLGLLRIRQPDLYEDFRNYLTVHLCEENLECWQSFAEILEETDKSKAVSRLQESFATFFSPSAPSQISCTEIYHTMILLCEECDGLSIEEIHTRVRGIQATLEHVSLQYMLGTWLINAPVS